MHRAAMIECARRPLRKREGRLGELGSRRGPAEVPSNSGRLGELGSRRGTAEVPSNRFEARSPARGMTLIEICIAIGIAAGLMAIAIPAVSNITRAQLRQKSGQLAGGLRSLYGASALRSATCRLVFDLDEGSYESECAKSTVRLSAEGEKSQNGKREKSKDEELLEEKNQQGLSDQDKAKLELLQKSAFSSTNDVPKTMLGKEVRFSSIWVEHQPEAYTAGKAFIYFWPTGVSEGASVQLAQGEDDVMSLIVSPLTGRVQVMNGAHDAPGQKK